MWEEQDTDITLLYPLHLCKTSGLDIIVKAVILYLCSPLSDYLESSITDSYFLQIQLIGETDSII